MRRRRHLCGTLHTLRHFSGVKQFVQESMTYLFVSIAAHWHHVLRTVTRMGKDTLQWIPSSHSNRATSRFAFAAGSRCRDSLSSPIDQLLPVLVGSIVHAYFLDVDDFDDSSIGWW